MNRAEINAEIAFVKAMHLLYESYGLVYDDDGYLDYLEGLVTSEEEEAWLAPERMDYETWARARDDSYGDYPYG